MLLLGFIAAYPLQAAKARMDAIPPGQLRVMLMS